jgi:hypothetical protein
MPASGSVQADPARLRNREFQRNGGMGQSGACRAPGERQMHAMALQRGHRDLLDFDPRGNLIVRDDRRFRVDAGSGGCAGGRVPVSRRTLRSRCASWS